MAKKLTDKTSYSYSKIKWTRSDTARLRNAINTFNKEVKKHMDSIPDKALPKLKEYKDVKSTIHSRKDLELAISTMKNIKKKNAFKLISSKENPNVKITNWELQTAKRYDRRNQMKLQIEYNKVISDIRKTSKPQLDIFGEPLLDEQGKPMVKATFSTAQKSKLESYLSKSNVEMLLESRDYERQQDLLERIYRRGTDEFDYKKAKQYKENYLKMFEGYQNLDNYEDVVDKLKSIDPKDFYDFIRDIDKEGSQNFDTHYNNHMVQAEFNNFARDIGIDIDDTYEPVTENIF